MRIHNIYADENGETHFRDMEIEMTEHGPDGSTSGRLPATGIGPEIDKPSPFASPEAEAAAWHRFKGEILREWSRPGRRPRYFWKFECELPPNCESESEAVWLIADAEECKLIEEQWIRAIKYCVRQHPRDRRAARKLARSWGDCPGWLFDEVVDEIVAELSAAAVV